MRFVIVAITGVVFAGHILFGCCWHQGHVETAQASAPQPCVHCHCGHHEHPEAPLAEHDESEPDHGDAPSDDGPSEPNTPCEHGRCSFVKCETQRTDLINADISWLPLAVIEVAVLSCEQSTDALALAVAVYPGDIPLHRLYCALLI